MNPDRIKTNVKFPEEVTDVRMVYYKDYLNGFPLKYETNAYLYNSSNQLVGYGVASCNCEKDTPNKRMGRDKALGRAVQDYYAYKMIENLS